MRSTMGKKKRKKQLKKTSNINGLIINNRIYVQWEKNDLAPCHSLYRGTGLRLCYENYRMDPFLRLCRVRQSAVSKVSPIRIAPAAIHW